VRRFPDLSVRLALYALDRPHALRRGNRRTRSSFSGTPARTAPNGSFGSRSRTSLDGGQRSVVAAAGRHEARQHDHHEPAPQSGKVSSRCAGFRHSPCGLPRRSRRRDGPAKVGLPREGRQNGPSNVNMPSEAGERGACAADQSARHRSAWILVRHRRAAEVHHHLRRHHAVRHHDVLAFVTAQHRIAERQPLHRPGLHTNR
jgi:hypothetical protein